MRPGGFSNASPGVGYTGVLTWNSEGVDEGMLMRVIAKTIEAVPFGGR
jgi:hypothetical protein